MDFRTQQLLQMADIDGHILFMKRLIEKYRFSKKERLQLQKDLKRIQDRQNEKTLNMAVIGEFSSGKSSFINALLRDNLLETDVIQGTTVASTLIRYSQKKVLQTSGKDGKGKKTRTLENSEELAKLLQMYTSGENKEENARYLEVGYPSDFLNQGICIIDTPGTNSLEQWHEDVTKTAIRNQADACIILTSAEKPFPESFCRFLEENLQDLLPTCVYVVTKIDLIPPKQQARQLEYIRKVLKEKLSVSDPLVLPYSALPVINGGGMEYIGSNREAEERILRFLQEQRLRIQLQRCVALLENAMGRLGDNMEQISARQEERHAQLMQAVTTDLESFVSGKRSEICRLYQEEADTKARDFGEKLDEWLRHGKAKVYEEFRKPMTEGELRTFLQAKLKPLLEEKKEEILRNAGMTGNPPTKFSKEICDMGEAYCRRFETEFKREYQQLALLAHDLVKEVEGGVSLDESLMVNAQADIAIRKKVTENSNKDDRSFLGNIGAGAAAGAAVGSVLPGLGTVTGAFIGGFVGILRWGRKSDDTSRGAAFRNQVSGDVSAMVEQYFRSLKDSILGIFRQSAADCRVQMERVMGQYLTQYIGIVEEMRRRDQKAQEEAVLKIREIQQDVDLTKQQMEQIQSVRSRLSQL